MDAADAIRHVGAPLKRGGSRLASSLVGKIEVLCMGGGLFYFYILSSFIPLDWLTQDIVRVLLCTNRNTRYLFLLPLISEFMHDETRNRRGRGQAVTLTACSAKTQTRTAEYSLAIANIL